MGIHQNLSKSKINLQYVPVGQFLETTSNLSSSLDVTSLSDSIKETTVGVSSNNQSVPDTSDVGEEGVCTSTPLAATMLRSSVVANVIKPVAYLEISDDSDVSSKHSCKFLYGVLRYGIKSVIWQFYVYVDFNSRF